MMARQDSNVMVLPTASACALWVDEIPGQISDGAWENSGPRDHWKFWCNTREVLLSKGTEPRTLTGYRWGCKKQGYNLTGLLEFIKDRMLATGRMGKALGKVHEREVFGAADQMPATLEEFMKSRTSGVWESEYKAKQMSPITDEMATKFYATTYTERELRADLKLIKRAMKNLVQL